MGYQGLEYYQVRTEEGHGVLHIFWAWRARMALGRDNSGSRRNGSRRNGKALHGAPVVWIKTYKPGRQSRNRLSHYVISQYVQDQSGYVNMCWSWKRSLGFPIRKMWEEMRQQWSDRNAYRRRHGEIEIPRVVLYRTWEDLLAGHAILLNGVILQLVLGKGLTWSPP